MRLLVKDLIAQSDGSLTIDPNNEKELTSLVDCVFSFFDRDHSGSIELEEFRKILSSHNALGKIMTIFNTEKTRDALALFVDNQKSKEQVEALFLKYDKDRNGKLSREDIKLFAEDCLAVLQTHASPESIENVIAMILHYGDEDKDGLLSLKEFTFFIQNMGKYKDTLHVDHSKINYDTFAGSLTKEKIESTFVVLDKDNSGYLEKSEIEGLGRELYKLGFDVLGDNFINVMNNQMKGTGYVLDKEGMIFHCGTLLGDTIWDLVDHKNNRITFDTFRVIEPSFWLPGGPVMQTFIPKIPTFITNNFSKVSKRSYY